MRSFITKDEIMNHDLTPREWHVAQLLAEAYSCREIGEILRLSTRTVENHRANIYDKLNVKNQHGIYEYVQWRKSHLAIVVPAEYFSDNMVVGAVIGSYADAWLANISGSQQ